jgi:ribonuclease HI
MAGFVGFSESSPNSFGFFRVFSDFFPSFERPRPQLFSWSTSEIGKFYDKKNRFLPGFSLGKFGFSGETKGLPIQIFCDGGISHNGRPEAKGTGYGSFEILVNRKRKFFENFFSLPDVWTSNMAEYGALIAALKTLQEWDLLEGREIQVFSDSELILGQVFSGWRFQVEHLLPLALEVHSLLENSKATGKWVPRAEMVRRFGH